MSAGAAERELEQDAATRLDYVGMQRSIRSGLSAVSPELARIETYSRGDLEATSATSLEDALAEAKPGAVVFVPGAIRLDLSGRPALRIPPGVTLASDRAVGSSQGGRLYTNDPGATLLIAGKNSRIAGLDLMGPDPGARTYQLERLRAERGKDGYYEIPTSIGILVEGSGVVVENCEVWAFGRSGVEIAPGARAVVVRHCFLHHNQRFGLGYGIYVDRGDLVAVANLFDWYRHCVAGSGRSGTSYEAGYNIMLPNASGHAFDMHGGRDRDDGTDLAGTRIQIYHNIVEAVQFPAVVIRGTPEQPVEVYENQFRNPDPAATLVLGGGSAEARVEGNQFGVSSLRVNPNVAKIAVEKRLPD